jgi:hypothetical protein
VQRPPRPSFGLGLNVPEPHAICQTQPLQLDIMDVFEACICGARHNGCVGSMHLSFVGTQLGLISTSQAIAGLAWQLYSHLQASQPPSESQAFWHATALLTLVAFGRAAQQRSEFAMIRMYLLRTIPVPQASAPTIMA